MPLMSSPLLLLLDATATPASQYGKPSPLLLPLLVEAASAGSWLLAAPLPLLLLLRALVLGAAAAGSTTRLMARPNFWANSKSLQQCRQAAAAIMELQHHCHGHYLAEPQHRDLLCCVVLCDAE